jgi:hypothetical protein
MEEFVSYGSQYRIREVPTAVTRAFCAVIDANETIREHGGLDKLENALANFIEIARPEKHPERRMGEYAAAVQEVLATRPVEIGVGMQRMRR